MLREPSWVVLLTGQTTAGFTVGLASKDQGSHNLLGYSAAFIVDESNPFGFRYAIIYQMSTPLQLQPSSQHLRLDDIARTALRTPALESPSLATYLAHQHGPHT